MRKLNLFDSTCLIIGIVVGTGIYKTPVTAAQAVDHTWELYLLWSLAGLISLCGAFCYAELATTYPESGGDVVYLSKAYGRGAGFLFGWLQTFVARPGDISMMALVFAEYVHVLLRASPGAVPIWPALMIVTGLTAINILGLQFGKTTQNLLTVVKILGLLLILALAAAFPVATEAAPKQPSTMSFGVALIVVMFTYGGWNEMVYVASEVREPKRNIPRALILGAISITGLYLLANAAFLRCLGLPGLAASKALATDVVARGVPRSGQMLVAVVIAISAAGAINGLVLTGARITGAMHDFAAFRWLGSWHPKFQTPVRALLLECVISLAVITVARTFENALIYTSSAVYSFYMATAVSTAIMRRKDPGAERLFRVPWYPWPLIIFSGACLWAIRSAINYRPQAALVCGGVILLGASVYLIQSRFEHQQAMEHE